MATPSLRPLSLGEILDAGIKVCTRHWKALALCVVIPVLPLAILQVLILASVDSDALELLPEGDMSATSDEFSTDVWVVLGTTYGLGLITFVVVNTVCFKAVADAWLGAEPSPRRSLRFGLRMTPRVLLLTLIWVLPMTVATVLCFLPAFWLGTVWSLSLAALMFERTGPFKALGRSFGLIKQRFWASLLLIIVSFALVGILGAIVSSIPSVFVEIFASENELALAVANVVGTTVGNVITYPYSAAVLTILYFDQRVRKEGFDVQMLAEGLGQPFDPNAPIPAPLRPVPYAPPPQTWQPQGGQYGGGWNAPSHQDAPLRWGPGAQQPPPPDTRPPEESPWMRPAPGASPPGESRWAGPSGPPPSGEPGAGPSRWAPPVGPPPSSPGAPPTGPGGSQPAGPGTPDESLWGRPAAPDGGLTSGSPLGDDPAPTDPLPPRDEDSSSSPAPAADAPAPTEPLPPRDEDASQPDTPAKGDERPSWESRWGGSSPFGESPWEDKGKAEDKRKDKDRADWQPPEEPRGPGGL